jgi:hypothetical protein
MRSNIALDTLDDDTLICIFSALTVPDILNLRQVRRTGSNRGFCSHLLEMSDMPQIPSVLKTADCVAEHWFISDHATRHTLFSETSFEFFCL